MESYSQFSDLAGFEHVQFLDPRSHLEESYNPLSYYHHGFASAPVSSPSRSIAPWSSLNCHARQPDAQAFQSPLRETLPYWLRDPSGLALEPLNHDSIGASSPRSASSIDMSLMSFGSDQSTDLFDLSSSNMTCVQPHDESASRQIPRITTAIRASQQRFQCSECLKSFMRLSDLRKHEKIHLAMNDRPYSCDACDFRFIIKKDLERHKRSKHPIESHVDCFPFGPAQRHKSGWSYCSHSRCSFATKGFARKDKYLEHLKKKHDTIMPKG